MSKALNKQDSNKLAKLAKDSSDMLEGKDKAREEKINSKLSEIMELDKFQELKSDIGTIWSLIEDYISGDYRYIPVTTISLFAGTIAWLVFDPTDLIPVVGRVDDIALVTWTLASFCDDLSKYKAWKALNMLDIKLQSGAINLDEVGVEVSEENMEKGTAKITIADKTYSYYFVYKEGKQIFFNLNQVVFYREAEVCGTSQQS